MRWSKGNSKINILMCTAFIILCLSVLAPMIQGMYRTNMDTAISYWESLGYVAYADEVGSLTPLEDGTADIGTTDLRFKDAYFSGDVTANSITAPTGRTATYVIAASDAPAHVKAQADYVCDGTADDVQIQAAIDATGCSTITYAGASRLPAIVKLIGSFSTAATITIPSYLTLDLTEAYIKLADGSDCDVIKATSSYYGAGGISYKPQIIGGVIDQNGSNQTDGWCVNWVAQEGTIRDTIITNGYSGGVWLNVGSRAENCLENTLDNVKIIRWLGNNSGVKFDISATDNIMSNCIVTKGAVDNTQGYGAFFGAGGNIVSNCHFYYGYCNIYITNKEHINLIGNYFNGVYANNGAEIILSQTGDYEVSHINITGNIFYTYNDYTSKSHILLSCATTGNMHDIVIVGNTFGSVNIIDGISTEGVGVPDRITITGNAFGEFGTAKPVDVSATNLTISGNTGYNVNPEIPVVAGNLLGTTVVTDGDFATEPTASGWVLGTGWTWDEGNARMAHATGQTAALSLSISGLTKYRLYKLQVTLAARTAGSLTTALGGTSASTTGGSTTLTRYVYAPSETATLSFTPTADWDIAYIDDVVLQPMPTTIWYNNTGRSIIIKEVDLVTKTQTAAAATMSAGIVTPNTITTSFTAPVTIFNAATLDDASPPWVKNSLVASDLGAMTKPLVLPNNQGLIFVIEDQNAPDLVAQLLINYEEVE